MSKKILVFITFLAVINFNTYPRENESYNFSLTEARNFALEHNLLIKNAKLAVNASEKQKWQAIANGLPQAEALMDYTNYFNYELEFQFGVPEDFEFTQDQLNEATTQTLNAFPGIPMAGISGVTAQDLYNHAAGNYYDSQLQQMMPATTILMSDQMSAKLQVSQLIFNGQYFIGIQTSKIANKLAQQSLEKTEEDVKELVTFAYYLVLLTQESLNTIEGNLKNLETTLEKSKALLQAGISEQTDIDQIKMKVSMLKNTQNSINRSLELSYNSLKFNLGINMNDELILTDSIEELIQYADAENSLSIPFHCEDNIQYQLLNSQVELSEKMVNMEKAGYLPTIAGFYIHNEKILTTDFDMNPKNLAGLNMSWPIFSSGLRNARLQEKKIELEKTKTTKELLLNQLLLEEKQNRYNLKNAIENYNLQKENMELANRVYQNIERKYNQGIVSSLDLTQASDNLLQAQDNYLSSVIEVLQSKLVLDKLLNNL